MGLLSHATSLNLQQILVVMLSAELPALTLIELTDRHLSVAGAHVHLAEF